MMRCRVAAYFGVFLYCAFWLAALVLVAAVVVGICAFVILMLISSCGEVCAVVAPVALCFFLAAVFVAVVAVAIEVAASFVQWITNAYIRAFCPPGTPIMPIPPDASGLPVV
jgi:hypothetical protein